MRSTKDRTPKSVSLVALSLSAERRAKAAYPWRWRPGQSGNPGGLSKFYIESRRVARDAAPDVMRELVRLALSAKDERVRSVCAVAVLDRAGVRPIDFDPNAGKDEGFDFNPRDYTPEQLERGARAGAAADD